MIIISVWLVCAIIAHGIIFAWSQKHYPQFAKEDYKKDIKRSLFFSFLGGPITLFVVVAVLLINKDGSLKHGLKFW